jgi:hypothetical protein
MPPISNSHTYNVFLIAHGDGRSPTRRNERYSTVTIRAVLLSYVVVLMVFALAWRG